MPRKPRKPHTVPAPDSPPATATEAIAAGTPAPTPAPETDPAPDGAPAGHPEQAPVDIWAKAVGRMGERFAGARDDLTGIRVDFERTPRPGRSYPRVLMTAPDANRFNDREREALKEHGFRFEAGSWAIRRSAETQELALRLANRFKKDRGDAERNFYIGLLC